MKIKDLDELENKFDEISEELMDIENLIEGLIEYIYANENFQDKEELIDVLKLKTIYLKREVDFIDRKLNKRFSRQQVCKTMFKKLAKLVFRV